MAGIIAGRDPASVNRHGASFVGIAPGAHLISLKVAAADGAVDVSQVIAAIDWVVAHRNDPGLNIRVLNLSFGTDSTQDAALDPLSHAVEAAWKQGHRGRGRGRQRRLAAAPGDDAGREPVRHRRRRRRPQGHRRRATTTSSPTSPTAATRPGTRTCSRPAGRWCRCATRAPTST